MAANEGKVAVVTGGTSGIGLEIARALAKDGVEVLIAGRDPARGEAAAAAAGAAGPVRFLRTDVADDDQVAALAMTAGERIDLWCNSAGVEGGIGPMEEMPDGTVAELLATNVKGTYSGIRYALPRMGADGLIVNIASFVVTRVPVPIAAAYGASKAAVVSLTAAVAAGIEDDGPRLVAVCPWVVYTPMVERLTGGGDPAAKADFAAGFAPSGKLTLPAEIASTVMDLLAGGVAFESGEAILVDAGPTVTPLAR